MNSGSIGAALAVFAVIWEQLSLLPLFIFSALLAYVTRIPTWIAD